VYIADILEVYRWVKANFHQLGNYETSFILQRLSNQLQFRCKSSCSHSELTQVVATGEYGCGNVRSRLSVCQSVCLSVCLSYLCSNFWRSWPETSLLVRGYTAQLQNTKVKFVCLCQRHRLKVTVTGAKQSEANWPYLDFFLHENADYSCLNRSRKRDTCFTLSVLS